VAVLPVFSALRTAKKKPGAGRVLGASVVIEGWSCWCWTEPARAKARAVGSGDGGQPEALGRVRWCLSAASAILIEAQESGPARCLVLAFQIEGYAALNGWPSRPPKIVFEMPNGDSVLVDA